MKRLVSFLLFGIIVVCVNAQSSSYEFSTKVEKETVLYSVKDTDSLYLDRWVAPDIKTEGRRPVLMFAFGGSFMRGSRYSDNYIPYFQYFLDKGFMVVSIDYRLGLKKAQESGSLNESTFPSFLFSTVRMATEDMIDATAYIIKNADKWNVDTGKIVASGSSAGAVTCLQTEYEICNKKLLSQRLPEGFNYAGVISFAGAIFTIGSDLEWTEKPCPILLFHGDADNAVPYDALRLGGAGGFGSKYIHDQLAGMKIPHWFYSVENAGHEIASRPMFDNHNEMGTFIDKLVLKKLQLIFSTDIQQLDQHEKKKDFTIRDFIHF